MSSWQDGRSSRADAGHHHRARVAEFLPFFVAERDGPASKLVEPFHRVNQVTVEGVSPHFPVGQYVDADAELEGDRLVNGTVLHTLEFHVRQFPGRELVARFFKVRGAQ
jgi:hypothetical protein